MGYTLALILGFFAFEFLGYLIHKLMHYPIAGKMYESHMTHHFTIYTPDRFLSDKYIGAGKDSTVIIFLPFALVLAGLIFWLLPFSYAIVLLIEMALVAYANSYLHDNMHVKGHWLERFDWFIRMRNLHYLHHSDVHVNYGIFHFTLDRLFNTFNTYEDPK